MKNTVTIEVGATPRGSVDTFIDQLTTVEHADWRAQATTSDIILHQHSSTTSRAWRITREQLAAGLADWAEQALAYIEATPEGWIRNAINIATGRWISVDPHADDWGYQVVSGYIAETFGTAQQ